MRNSIVGAAILAVLPAVAFAHVTVAPREGKPGVEQQYTVRVPTEGQVATTSVYLEVPDGVIVTDVPHPEGATHQVKKTPGTKLTNTPATPAAARAASQTGGHPAGGHQATGTGEAAVIEKWLAEYDAAFNAKDLQKLGTFYHPEVTIYEGGGIDNGWAAYRDGHLGPELKAFDNLQFGHSNRQIHVLGDGTTAYAISAYSLKAKMGERNIDSGGLETLVLLKGADGGWKIRHSHTSSRPRRPAQ